MVDVFIWKSWLAVTIEELTMMIKNILFELKKVKKKLEWKMRKMLHIINWQEINEQWRRK